MRYETVLEDKIAPLGRLPDDGRVTTPSMQARPTFTQINSGDVHMDPKIIQAVMAPAFLVFGLSHLVQPQLWVRFFEVVRRTGLAAVIIPMYTLPISLVLVVGHNVWRWEWSVFLTIAGWVMTIKCATYLLAPGLVEHLLERNVVKSRRSYQVAGAIMALFGSVLTWQAWTRF